MDDTTRPAPARIAPKVKPFPRERFEAWLKTLRIQTKDFGLQTFKMLGSQSYVLDEICQGLEKGISTFVILKARQLGMSTFFIALDLFWAMEHPGLCGTFATHTDTSKAQFRNIIKVFLRHLPASHKIQHETENRDMIILKNSSMFVYLVAGVKEKTTSNMGRSGASNFLHATEVGFWGSPEDKKELVATMSTHYAHRLEIYESTANGYNHFQEQWEQAKDSPTQKTIFVGWWRNELYAFEQGHPWFPHYMPHGIETTFNPLERKRAKEVKEQYGFTVTPEQIAWYRWYLAEKADGDQSKMDEQFPWTEEDAFVATGARFFTNESLTDAFKRARKIPFLPFSYSLKQRWQDTQVLPVKNQSRATLKIYEEPDPLGEYVMGVDPSYGSSDTADRNCIHVARCFSDRLVQVAEFCAADAAAYQCAWVLAHLAGWYRNVMVNLEITGPGTAVWDELLQLRNAVQQARIETSEDGKPIAANAPPELRHVLMNIRHYLYRKPDHPGELAHHWRTTHETKKVAMVSFRDAFELRRHIINSMHCLDEMKGIVQDEGYIGGEGRSKDDRVIAAALAHIAWKQWIQPRLRNMGLTFERAMRESQTGRPNMIQKMAIDYLRNAKILLPGENIGDG